MMFLVIFGLPILVIFCMIAWIFISLDRESKRDHELALAKLSLAKARELPKNCTHCGAPVS